MLHNLSVETKMSGKHKVQILGPFICFTLADILVTCVDTVVTIGLPPLSVFLSIAIWYKPHESKYSFLGCCYLWRSSSFTAFDVNSKLQRKYYKGVRDIAVFPILPATRLHAMAKANIVIRPKLSRK